jgi:hypothetical protein
MDRHDRRLGTPRRVGGDDDRAARRTYIADAADVATLPFLVEAYGDRRNAAEVSKVALASRRIRDPHFVAGVELLRWNAVPMDRAVDIHADRETGERPDARRGRALNADVPRCNTWPRRTRTGDRRLPHQGRSHEVRFDWRVVKPGRALTEDRNAPVSAAIDPEAETARRVKPSSHRSLVRSTPQRRPRHARHKPRPEVGEWIHNEFQDGRRQGDQDEVEDLGYCASGASTLPTHRLRRRRARLLLLPQRGLIVDLRESGRAHLAAERMLQLATTPRDRRVLDAATAIQP